MTDPKASEIEVVALLPCPFCGRTDLLSVEPQPEGGFLAVKCRACGTHGPSRTAENATEAILFWNRRAALDAARTPEATPRDVPAETYRQLHDLVTTLLENDPDEPAADGGVTVLDVWRDRARTVLLRSEPSDGAIYAAVSARDANAHDVEAEGGRATCEECGNPLVLTCSKCDADRAAGEAFVRTHGMPDGISTPATARGGKL